MTANKTQPTSASIEAYLSSIKHPGRQADCRELCRIMGEIGGEPPVLWGPSMVGFSSHHYTYASGREGDMFKVGFAARGSAIVLYGLHDHEAAASQLEGLGEYTSSKACIYIKRLADVNMPVLQNLVRLALTPRSVE